MVNIGGTLGVDVGVYGGPETDVVDAEGVVRNRHVGVVDAEVWEEQLQQYFGED